MNRNALLWVGLALLGAAALTGGGVIAVNLWKQSANAQKWAGYLANIEDAYGIPRDLLARIAYQESHFSQDIIDGTRPSRAGALGMMQLMPQYFSTVQRPIPFTDQDTQDQITEAAQLLVNLFHQFGNWTDAVAAYNAGAGAIKGVLAGTRSLSQETADYIRSVFTDLPQYGSTTLSVNA